MQKPTMDNLKNGMKLYDDGHRPWPERIVDWFILCEGKIFPLKYTYALSTNQRPATFTTNQAKSAMRHLSITYVSLKAQSNINLEFDDEVEKSRKDQKGRKNRLERASKNPTQSMVVNVVFNRNADVVAEVLERAKGVCEGCGSGAPFIKRNGEPYLEVHHVIQLAHGGEDSVENAQALCPNCHRKAHFG